MSEEQQGPRAFSDEFTKLHQFRSKSESLFWEPFVHTIERIISLKLSKHFPIQLGQQGLASEIHTEPAGSEHAAYVFVWCFVQKCYLLKGKPGVCLMSIIKVSMQAQHFGVMLTLSMKLPIHLLIYRNFKSSHLHRGNVIPLNRLYISVQWDAAASFRL